MSYYCVFPIIIFSLYENTRQKVQSIAMTLITYHSKGPAVFVK